MQATFRARVRNGRLILNEPIDLPDGTEVELTPFGSEDELDEADTARLHQALLASEEEFQAGLGIPASEVLEDLRHARI